MENIDLALHALSREIFYDMTWAQGRNLSCRLEVMYIESNEDECYLELLKLCYENRAPNVL